MLTDFHAHLPSRQTLHQRTATTISLSTITIKYHVPLSILLSYSTTLPSPPYPFFHSSHSSHKALCIEDGQHLSFTSILRVVPLMHTSYQPSTSPLCCHRLPSTLSIHPNCIRNTYPHLPFERQCIPTNHSCHHSH